MLRESTIGGASIGLGAGALVGGLDAGLILHGSGAFWLGIPALLEPVLVFASAGLAAGAAVGALGRRSPVSVGLVGALVVGAGIAAVAGFHLYDVGLPVESRAAPSPYVGALLAALAVAALLWLAHRRLAAAPGRALALGPGLAIVTALFLVGGRAIVAAGELRAGGGRDDQPDLVLVVMDTTRYDALRVNGGARPTSPHLDAMAAHSWVFRRAYAPSSWTPPSHASLFTGTYPSAHGTLLYDSRLKTGLPTLAEALQERGYETGFFSQKDLLPRRDGWARGFRTAVTANVEDRPRPLYRRLLSAWRSGQTETPLLVDLAVRWMESAQARDAPFLAFLNLNDPHTPYEPREPHLSRFADERQRALLASEKLRQIAHNQGTRWEEGGLDAAEAEALRALYDSETAFLDAELGRLLAWLRASHRARPLAVVITADHGEFLGEHGLLYHARYPYEEMIHVPLLFWSTSSPAGGVSDELVSLVDVFPTLLDLAGGEVAAFPHLQGRRLLRDVPPAMVFGEVWKDARLERQRHAPVTAVRKIAITSDLKRVWELDGPGRLFSLAQDPREAVDLAAGRPEEAARLDAALDAAFDLRAAAEAREAYVLDDATRRRLEALGYLQ